MHFITGGRVLLCTLMHILMLDYFIFCLLQMLTDGTDVKRWRHPFTAEHPQKTVVHLQEKTSLQTLSDGRNHYLHMLTGWRISRPVEILSFIHLLTSGGSSQVFPIRESKTWSAQLESIGNFCKQLWLIKYPVSEFIMSMNLQLWDRERRLWSPADCLSVKYADIWPPKTQIQMWCVSLEHKRSHNNTGIFVEIANNTLYGSKL